MFPETSSTGNFETNLFHFQQMDLEVVRLIREGVVRLIVLGERRSVVLVDRKRQLIKNSSIYNG